MKTGLLDSRLDMHELPFYEIEGLCENIVQTAITKSEKYRETYEEYKRKITRFSPAFEFCMHELGWMLYDPFCLGQDEVLFSNGHRCYLASLDYVKTPGFDRKKIDNEEMGFPRLDDETVGYDPKISVDSIKEGIVDSKGYIDCGFTDSLGTLAEIMVMNENIKDKEAYLDCLRSREDYPTRLDYLTSKKNVIAAKKLEDNTVSLRYVSENDGLVQEFIDRLRETNQLADLIPIIGNEDTHLMKTA